MKAWRFGAVVFAISVGLAIFSACGSEKDDDKTSTEEGTVTWADDIQPIVQQHCLGAACHSTSSGQPPVLEGSSAESNFKNNANVASQLSSGAMPQPGTEQAQGFTNAKKQKLLSFYKQ